MAIIKCKMCGGDLAITEGLTIAECEYCGTKQTIPRLDDEKITSLFDRATICRSRNEFDKASMIYENIINESPDEAEAYWGLCLCRYGIGYVEDPRSGKRIPTCHRTQFKSILEDENYIHAVKMADVLAKDVYRKEAEYIDKVQKSILEISSKEEPFDIFICYKESDENGDRTKDSVIAQDIYTGLTEKGYKVFFSKITLEDKLGSAYEPYIFAALNSAKVMLVVGTKKEHFNAVWVKNEWGRYLSLIEQGQKKTIITCFKDISANDLPDEFVPLQGQDMGKIGAMQDLFRGVDKLFDKDISSKVASVKSTASGVEDSVISLLKRGNMALEDGKWNEAKGFFERILDLVPENAEAHLGCAMADFRVVRPEALLVKYDLDKQNVTSETLTFEIPVELKEFRDEISKENEVLRRVKKEDLDKYLSVELSYTSETASLEKCYNNVSRELANKEFVRAISFADEALKSKLDKIRYDVLSKYEKAVSDSKEKEQKEIKAKLDDYKAFLEKQSKKMNELKAQAENNRNKDERPDGILGIVMILLMIIVVIQVVWTIIDDVQHNRSIIGSVFGMVVFTGIAFFIAYGIAYFISLLFSFLKASKKEIREEENLKKEIQNNFDEFNASVGKELA